MADPVWSTTIGGTEREYRLGSFSVQRVLNGVHTARFEVLSIGGAYRPALGAEAIVLRDGVREFAGYIKKTTEYGADKHPTSDIATLVDCTDYNIIGERRFVTETIPAGSTLKEALQLLEPYVTDFGVSLSGSQSDGPTIDEAITFDGVLWSECINRLSQRTGYFGGIDYNKVLRLVTFGEVAAPFDDIDGSDENSVGDVEVERTRGKYANRIIFKYGSNMVVDEVDVFTGDGVEDEFTLEYPIIGPIPFSDSDSAVGNAVVDYNTFESLGGLTGVDFLWEYDPSVPSVRRRAAPPGNGDTFQVRYQRQSPQTVIVEDSGEITANGLYELLVVDEKIFDKTEAQAMAETYLSQALAVLETTKIDTYRPGLLPGQTMTLTIGDRSVTGSWLVQTVNVVNPSNLQDLRYSAGVINSDTYRATFRQLYKDWLGGGSKAAAGNGAVAATGGGVPYPPERAVQVNRAGQFYGSNELLHDYDGGGETFGVEAKAATLASLPTDEAKALSFAFGNRTAGIAKALTGWQLDDGTFYLELDAGKALNIYVYGSGNALQLAGTQGSFLAGETGTAGSHLRLGKLLAMDAQFPGVQRKTASFTLNASFSGGGLPENVVILDSSTARVVTLPVVTDDMISLGATDSWSRTVKFINIGTAVWALTPASGTIEGLSTLPVMPGQRLEIQAFAGTGAGWFVVSNYIKPAVVTLTDAQIKALPTTPITVVPSPGSGYRIRMLAASSYLKTGSGAYTNINGTYAAIALQNDGGSWVSAAMVNDTNYTTDVTEVSGYLGAAAEKYIDWAIPTATTITEPTDGNAEWFLVNPTGSVAPLADFDDSPIQLGMDNNGSGNLTGGHSANTWRFICYYTVEALS